MIGTGIGKTNASPGKEMNMKQAQPNIVFVLTDQWRAQAFGYAGDPNVKTPRRPWRNGDIRSWKIRKSVTMVIS